MTDVKENILEKSPIVKFAKELKSRENLIEDLKQTVSDMCNINKEYMLDQDCVLILANIVAKIMVASGRPSQIFTEFLSDIFPNNCYRVGYHTTPTHAKGTDYDVNHAIIYKLISIIRLSDVDVLEKALNM